LKGKVVLSTLGIMVSTLYCRISFHRKILFKFKDNDKIVFVMINLDDDIATENSFLDKKIFIAHFQAVSAVPKKFIRDHYLLQSF
jgi:hypothetical protein